MLKNVDASHKMNFQDHIELFQSIKSGRADVIKNKLESLENSFEGNVLCGFIRYIKSFIQEEYTIDSPCHDGRYEEFVGLTPLEFAIKNVNTDIVKLLLNYGANFVEISYLMYEGDRVSISHSVPLITAVESGNIEIVELLLKYGANIREIHFPLLHAVKGNNPDMVKLFLENALKPLYEGQWYELFDIAIKNKNKDVLAILLNDSEMILKPSETRALLCKAVKQNDISIVKFLIDRGLSSDTYTLFPAIDNRNSKMLQLLLTHGFHDDINRDVGDYHKTPLSWAIKSRYYEGVKCLLKNGAKMHHLSRWPSEFKFYNEQEDSYIGLLSHESSAEEESQSDQESLIGDLWEDAS